MTTFRVAAVFSSNMVLQRDKKIKIFGQGENDAIVTVLFQDEIYKAVVKKDQWCVILPSRSAGTGYEMTIRCKSEERKFSNIAIGEVWLAGGQSNMEFELRNCTGGKEMLQKDVDPRVRFYYTNKNAQMDEHFYEQEQNTQWSEFSEENAKCWSAVGYMFAKKLAKELGVTVGVIGCNWGGTSASCWIDEKSLKEDAELNTYLLDYNKAIEGKTEEQQITEYKEYEAYHTAWDNKCSELYAKKPEATWEEALDFCGENKWPGPMSCINPYRPSGLYQCMLQRIIPYTLRGFIYYQGESDDHKPNMYQKLLTKMIQQWRKEWEDQTLPFLMVQLPRHRYIADPDFKNWCLIREAQMNTFQTIKNTGIAVILDCGEFNEIHPKDKSQVGERLALQALYHVHDRITENEAFGPIYKDFEYKNTHIELSFDHAEEGFIIRGKANGFEIAGEDKNFVVADVEIIGSKILVSLATIDKPVFVRYCWTNYGEVTIFGKNGIPLAPFRISDKDQ